MHKKCVCTPQNGGSSMCAQRGNRWSRAHRLLNELAGVRGGAAGQPGGGWLEWSAVLHAGDSLPAVLRPSLCSGLNVAIIAFS